MPERGDRWYHFFIYLLAGAFMGGFLDVTAFHMSTPVYGIVSMSVARVVALAASRSRPASASTSPCNAPP